MAKKIIILERLDEPSDYNFNVLFWLDVPAERQRFFANPAATSAYKDATPEEIAAIQNGQIKEVVQKCSYLAGTTIAAIIADLQAKYSANQAALNSHNPWVRYGTYWDGSSWTQQGTG